jgi:uncharacterized alkaline shock family protein YloU
MTRIIQHVLIAICLGLFFVIALLLMFQLSAWQPVHDFGASVIGKMSPMLQGTILVFAMLLMVAILVLAFERMRQEVHITRETENGTVTIVESAIARFVQQAVAEVEAVKRRTVRARITNTRAGLVVDVRTRVVATEPLPRIEQTIRSRVRQSLDRVLGTGAVAVINVVIDGFEETGARAAEAAPAGAPAETGGEAPSPAPEPAPAPAPSSPVAAEPPEIPIATRDQAIPPKPETQRPAREEGPDTQKPDSNGGPTTQRPAREERPESVEPPSWSFEQATSPVPVNDEPSIAPFEEFGRDLTTGPDVEPAQPQHAESEQNVTSGSRPETAESERPEGRD